MKDLIQWHQQRADELDAQADQATKKANDGRCSKFTRKHNMHIAGVFRGMADRHKQTIAALQELIADRERLEWVSKRCVIWIGDEFRGPIYEASADQAYSKTLRQAIDKARHG